MTYLYIDCICLSGKSVAPILWFAQLSQEDDITFRSARRNTAVSPTHPQTADWTMKEQQYTDESSAVLTLLLPPFSLLPVTIYTCSKA